MLRFFKRFLIAASVFIAALLVTLVMLLQFTDWTRYKDDILNQINDPAHDLKRPKLSIDGDIKVQLFPAPRLVMSKFALDNIEGGDAQHMLTGDQLDLVSSWSSLFSGDLRIDSLVLRHPKIALEFRPNGQSNFEHVFATQPTKTQQIIRQGQQSEDAVISAPLSESTQNNAESHLLSTFIDSLLLVKKIELKDAIISCHDLNVRSKSNSFSSACFGHDRFSLVDINADLEAQDAQQSYTATFTAHSQGVPVNAQLRLKNLFKNSPASVDLKLQAGEANLTFAGVYDTSASPFLDGTIELKADSLDAALQNALFGQKADETFSVQTLLPVDLTANFIANEGARYEVPSFNGTLNTTTLSGAFAYDGLAQFLSGNLRIKDFNFDTLLESQPSTSLDISSDNLASNNISVDDNAQTSQGWLKNWELDGDINGLTIGKETLRTVQFKANGMGTGSGLAPFKTIKAFTLNASLPWGGGVALNGNADFSTPLTKFSIGYGVRFEDGQRGLKWLGLGDFSIENEQLRKIESTGKVFGTLDKFQVIQANFKANDSNVDAEFQVVRDEEQTGLYIQAKTNTLNLDTWLTPKTQEEIRNILPKPTSSAVAALATLPLDISTLTNLLNGEPGLVVEFDLKAHELRHQTHSYNEFEFVGRLDTGGLIISHLSAQDKAGIVGKLVGHIPPVPDLEMNLRADVSAPSAKSFFTSLGTRPIGAMWSDDAPLMSAGPIALSWVKTGNSNEPNIQAIFKSGGIELELDGTFFSSSGPLAGNQLNCNFRVRLSHISAQKLYKLIHAPYPIAPPEVPISLTGHTQGCFETLKIKSISGTVGDMPFSGELTINEDRKISGTLKLGNLDLDDWLINAPVYTAIPGPFAPTPATQQGDSRKWSNSKSSDLWLAHANGTWRLEAQSLQRGNLEIKKQVLNLEIEGGRLTTSVCSGRIYGGTYTCSYRREPGHETHYSLKLRDAVVPDGIMGLKGIDLKGSRINFDLTARTNGKSEANQVSKLQARGKVTAVGGELTGMNLQVLHEGYEKHGSLASDITKKFEHALSSGTTPLKRLEFNFSVEDGVFASRDFVFETQPDMAMTARYALRYDMKTGSIDNLGDIEGSPKLKRIPVRHVGKLGQSSVRIDEIALTDMISEAEFQKLQTNLTAPKKTENPKPSDPSLETDTDGNSLGILLKNVLQDE